MVKSYSVNVCDYPQNYHEILNLKNIQFPMALKGISKFENQNPNVSVNVIGINKRGDIVDPLYHTEHVRDHHVNLLYLTNKCANHYCWIYDLSRLCLS